MFLRAIAAARRFIYIEDQYLVNPEASEALIRAIPHIAHLTILIPHSDISDLVLTATAAYVTRHPPLEADPEVKHPEDSNPPDHRPRV